MRSWLPALLVLCVAEGVAGRARAQDETVVVSRHRLHATLEDGIALVFEELTPGPAFDDGSAISLELPEGAVLVSLEACAAHTCAPGLPFTDGSSVFDAARYVPLARGAAPLVLASQHGSTVTLRVARLERGRTVIRLGWSAETTTRGGRERLRVPAREEEVEVELAAARLDALAVDGDEVRRRVEAGATFELSGRMTVSAAEVVVGVVRTAGGAAGWARVVAPPVPPSHDPVVIFVDVSPSAWPREGALRGALESVLAVLPGDVDTRVIAFARHAREIAHDRAERLRSAELALPRDLGSMTSALAVRDALDAIRASDATIRALWLGDGGLAWGPAEASAVDAMRAEGMRFVSFVEAHGTSRVISALTLAQGDVVAGRERAEALLAPPVEVRVGATAIVTHPGEASWVALASAPVVRGGRRSPLPPGAIAPLVQAQLSLGPGTVDLLTLDPRERATAAKIENGRVGVFRRGGGLAPPTWHGRRWARVIRCRLGCLLTVSGAASRQALRRMIRRTVAPRVRGCFAAERRGRPDWEGRATIVLGLEGPEVGFASVETESPSLRDCILEAVDHLQPPSDESAPERRTILRYPFASERVARPAAVPLHASTEAQLERLLGEVPAGVPSEVADLL